MAAAERGAATEEQRLQPPSLFLMLAEARSLFELNSSLLLSPLLLRAPKGDGHPVLTLPGFLASDLSMAPMRRYLRELGYDAYSWKMGRNIGGVSRMRAALRDRLEAGLLERIPDAVIHGRGAPRAPHITSISVPGTDSESLLMALDLRGIACSAGSACQSGSVTPSHVLAAIGVPADLASSAIRMSLGCLSTDACVDRVVDVFPMLVEKARRLATA